MKLADLDHDGRRDEIVFATGDDTFAYDENGTERWSSPVNTNEVRDIAVADLDDDGFADEVAYHDSGWGLRIIDDNGSTLYSSPDYNFGYGPVAIGDIDGDGEPEVIISDTSSDNISVFKGNGSVWSLNWSYNLGTSGAGSSNILLEDMDGDSVLDIIHTADSHNVSIINGSGTVLYSYLNSWERFISFDLADIDHDGEKKDIYAGGERHARSYKQNSGRILGGGIP